MAYQLITECHSRRCVFEICSSDFEGATRNSTRSINVFVIHCCFCSSSWIHCWLLLAVLSNYFRHLVTSLLLPVQVFCCLAIYGGTLMWTRSSKRGILYFTFVKRNLYVCSEETKQAAYVSLVRPHLEYVTAVWDPYRQNQLEKLEAVQSRAVRFIKHDDYDYNTSVSKLEKSLS